MDSKQLKLQLIQKIMDEQDPEVLITIARILDLTDDLKIAAKGAINRAPQSDIRDIQDELDDLFQGKNEYS